MTLSTEDMHGFYTIERPCDVITEADIESYEEYSVCEFINHVHACMSCTIVQQDDTYMYIC